MGWSGETGKSIWYTLHMRRYWIKLVAFTVGLYRSVFLMTKLSEGPDEINSSTSFPSRIVIKIVKFMKLIQSYVHLWDQLRGHYVNNSPVFLFWPSKDWVTILCWLFSLVDINYMWILIIYLKQSFANVCVNLFYSLQQTYCHSSPYSDEYFLWHFKNITFQMNVSCFHLPFTLPKLYIHKIQKKLYKIKSPFTFMSLLAKWF
jgi:hypothetical protein